MTRTRMSAGQYEDNKDKNVMGYEPPRRIRRREGVSNESVRVSLASRDKTEDAMIER
jgi:hypothetical protein